MIQKFQHDSDCDTFLGSETIEDVSYDLYVCPGKTYIARFGDEGGEYFSGVFFVGLSPSITRAHELATAQGLALRV